MNDSAVDSICVALAGLERRLLNKGVGGDGVRKDHISQSARRKKEKADFSSQASVAAIPVFLFVSLQRRHIWTMHACTDPNRQTVLKKRRLAERVQEAELINSFHIKCTVFKVTKYDTESFEA